LYVLYLSSSTNLFCWRFFSFFHTLLFRSHSLQSVQLSSEGIAPESTSSSSGPIECQVEGKNIIRTSLTGTLDLLGWRRWRRRWWCRWCFFDQRFNHRPQIFEWIPAFICRLTFHHHLSVLEDKVSFGVAPPSLHELVIHSIDKHWNLVIEFLHKCLCNLNSILECLVLVDLNMPS